VPLAFAIHGLRDTTGAQAAIALALLALAAPIFRYLIGTVLVDTRGTVLAVGVLHGAFNAAGSRAAVHGGWQYTPAMFVPTLLVVIYRSWRQRSAVHGPSGSGPVPV
jgi:hypothetical protein